jgi:hypothetical protein
MAHVASWYGTAYGSSNRIARGGYGVNLAADGVEPNAQVVAVVGTTPPYRQQLLAFGWPGRQKDCCQVLGWLDDQTVLMTSLGDHGSRVLAWDTDNGRVSRVATYPTQTVLSVAAVTAR